MKQLQNPLDSKQQRDKREIHGIFPSPIYITKYVTNQDSSIDSQEQKEIEDIIKEPMHQDGTLDYHTNDTYIFDTKLKHLKEFCEHHIKIYVKDIINPKEELDFYITQSWINVIEPGEGEAIGNGRRKFGSIHRHWHENSIISGVYYPAVTEGDTISFYDPVFKRSNCMITIPPKDGNSPTFNMSTIYMYVNTHDLLLFPSWLEHSVAPNEKSTKNRISISFNVFAKGIFGGKEINLNRLVI